MDGPVKGCHHVELPLRDLGLLLDTKKSEQ